MNITIDIPDDLYNRLTRIAEAQDVSVETLVLQNLDDVFYHEWKQHFVPNASRDEAMDILRKHGEGREPEERDRL